MTEGGPEFLAIFRDEATERLDHIVDTLLALETGHAAPDAVHSLFRDAHTITGAAGSTGLEDVQVPPQTGRDGLGEVRRPGAVPGVPPPPRGPR